MTIVGNNEIVAEITRVDGLIRLPATMKNIPPVTAWEVQLTLQSPERFRSDPFRGEVACQLQSSGEVASSVRLPFTYELRPPVTAIPSRVAEKADRDGPTHRGEILMLFNDDLLSGSPLTDFQVNVSGSEDEALAVELIKSETGATKLFWKFQPRKIGVATFSVEVSELAPDNSVLCQVPFTFIVK